MTIPITYGADRSKVEAIMLNTAQKFGGNPTDFANETKAELQSRFGVDPIDLVPKVFFRITDNWMELTVRFILTTHGVRSIKDSMSRYILAELDASGIGIASATYDIVGLPPIRL